MIGSFIKNHLLIWSVF